MKKKPLIPIYQPTETFAGCQEHADPECLCDVHVGIPTPIIEGPHMFHDVALHYVDGYMVDARNMYDYMCARLGWFEASARVGRCVQCGCEFVRNHSTHLTCSDACRMKKSRLTRQGLFLTEKEKV